MLTVDKTMTLLGFFTPALPEIGLSELARLAELDKAATRRFLVALEKHGFIEQNRTTKKYRLGSAFLRFARIREATFPLASIVQPVLEDLSTATGETAHASISSGSALVTIGISEPQRSTRVYVDPSQLLPYHATASGMAFLAFSADGFLDEHLKSGDLVKHTPKTTVSAKEIRRLATQTLEAGYYMAVSSFEEDVIGIASPLFDWSGNSFGAIAVATVASRMTPEKQTEVSKAVVEAAISITRATGAEPHPNLMKALEGFTNAPKRKGSGT